MGSWDVETSCGEEKHGDEIIGGAETTCLAFDGGEDAVEALEEGVGGAAYPVGDDAFQVALNHVGGLDHGSEERLEVLARHPAHPAAPGP